MIKKLGYVIVSNDNRYISGSFKSKTAANRALREARLSSDVQQSVGELWEDSADDE